MSGAWSSCGNSMLSKPESRDGRINDPRAANFATTGPTNLSFIDSRRAALPYAPTIQEPGQRCSISMWSAGGVAFLSTGATMRKRGRTSEKFSCQLRSIKPGAARPELESAPSHKRSGPGSRNSEILRELCNPGKVMAAADVHASNTSQVVDSSREPTMSRPSSVSAEPRSRKVPDDAPHTTGTSCLWSSAKNVSAALQGCLSSNCWYQVRLGPKPGARAKTSTEGSWRRKATAKAVCGFVTASLK
mmetsp:Transcript_16585/g.31333  ORF Transcript_16585/g.31333 Transcript_16585/m.31333 type:complete len:246 (-) Transcript_16585:85-822(-)